MLLTAKQFKTYQFIHKYILRQGKSPTIQEITTGVGIISRGVIHRYLQALIKAGLITMIPRQRRSICLTDTLHDSPQLPIIGKIAAGSPIKDIDEKEVLDFSKWLLTSNRVVFRVQHDMNLGIQICAGDYVLCEQKQWNIGNIVVIANKNNETVLGQIKEINNETELVCLLEIDNQRIDHAIRADQIIGVYVGLIRLRNAQTAKNDG